MKKTELKMRTATCLILLIVSGIAGITALFLPFTMDISPIAYFFGFLLSFPSNTEFWLFLLLAMPFFLSVFVPAAFLRWMISGLLSRTELVIAHVISSMMALGTLYFIIDLFLEILRAPLFEFLRFWLTGVISLVLLICGAYSVIRSLKNKLPKEVSAVMAMQIVYLSNALLCLIFFVKGAGLIKGGLQIGAYLVVVTASIYLTQIVMATVKLGVFRRGGESDSA